MYYILALVVILLSSCSYQESNIAKQERFRPAKNIDYLIQQKTVPKLNPKQNDSKLENNKKKEFDSTLVEVNDYYSYEPAKFEVKINNITGSEFDRYRTRYQVDGK